MSESHIRCHRKNQDRTQLLKLLSGERASRRARFMVIRSRRESIRKEQVSRWSQKRCLVIRAFHFQAITRMWALNEWNNEQYLCLSFEVSHLSLIVQCLCCCFVLLCPVSPATPACSHTLQHCSSLTYDSLRCTMSRKKIQNKNRC